MAFTFVSAESFDDLREIAKVVTGRMRGPDTPATEPISELGKVCREVLTASTMGGHRSSAKKIFAVLVKHLAHDDVSLLGLDSLGDAETVYSYPRYSVVVPLEPKCGHNYPVGQPFLVRSERRGFKIDGDTGNNHHGSWRYASDAEIDAYFDAIPEVAKDYIFTHMI
jgi:hypothetical protein